MADKVFVVDTQHSLKEAKQFVLQNSTSTDIGTASKLAQIYYDTALERIMYVTTSAQSQSTTLLWRPVPRLDANEGVSGLWVFGRSGKPFGVTNDTMVDNLTANKLGSGKWLAQLAVAADVIPVRTKRTGSQGTEYDGQIHVPQTPIDPTHAASRYFVEQLLHGNVEKPACRVASTRNLAADFDATAGTLTSTTNAFLNTTGIDGVTDLAVGDRVLILGQGYQHVLSILGSDNPANGIYTVSALGEVGNAKWVLTRAEDMDSDLDVQDGATCFVAQGTNLAQTQWALITHRPIDLNTDALQFTRTSGTRTAHTHPAGEITRGTFRDSQPYNFRGALIVGSAYYSSGTGIFFGATAESQGNVARITQVGGTNTLVLRGGPTTSQALLTLNSTGSGEPRLNATKGSLDRGGIKFNSNNTSFSKPVQPPENPTAAAWGTLHRTKSGAGSAERKKPMWQTTGQISHAIARKFVVEIAPNGTLGTDAAPFPINHNLGTREVVIQVRRVSDYKEVIVEAYADSDDTAKVSFGIAPTSANGNYKVIVIG